MPQPVHEAIVVEDTLLRLGPGEAYPVVGNVAAGGLVQVYARTENSEWLQVDPAGFTWIATRFVQLEGDLSDVEVASAIPPVPIPTDTPAGPPAAPRQTATPDGETPTAEEPEPTPLPSGGLGLSPSEWEAQFGEGVYDEETARYEYLGGAGAGGFDVVFQDDLIRFLRIQFEEDAALPPDEMDAFVAPLIPADSELLDVYTPEGMPNVSIAVYRSQWLSAQFGGEAAWRNEPGWFTVQVETEEGLATGASLSVDLAIGEADEDSSRESQP